MGLLLTSLLGLLPIGQAANSQQGEERPNSTARLHVHGALTESACRLETPSAWQEVSLGEADPRGQPVAVQLYLRDCMRTPSTLHDGHSDNLRWSAHQPVATLSFIAPADPDIPALLQVQGAKGLGLRIQDEAGRDIRLGNQGTPLQLISGQPPWSTPW